MLKLNIPLCSTLCMLIDKALMDETRCGAVSQAVNGCAAHSSRRLLTRRAYYHFCHNTFRDSGKNGL